MIRIHILGDFVSIGEGINAVKNNTAVAENMVESFRQSDMTIINLEAPIVQKDCFPIEKIGPNLSMEKDTISYLKRIGITTFTFANNHFYDFGEAGVKATIGASENEGIEFVGGGRNPEEKNKVLYKHFHDTTVAVLNFCEAEFSVNHFSGSNHINPIHAFYEIKDAKEKADIVLVITHGGHEGYSLPSPRMQELYRFFIDAGANMVVNHHQHCYSGAENYKHGFIFYGLGNFFFYSSDEEEQGWDEGFYLELMIDQKKIVRVIKHPYVQCKAGDCQTRLMNEEETDAFNDAFENLSKIIADEGLLCKNFSDFCKQKKANYLSMLSPYNNRYLRALCKRHLLPSFLTKCKKLSLLNTIRCESHRDVLLNILSKFDG